MSRTKKLLRPSEHVVRNVVRNLLHSLLHLKMRKRVLGVIDTTQGKRIDSIKRHNLFITFDTNHHSVRFCILPILRLFQRLHSLPVLSLFNVMGNQIVISQKSPTYPLDVISSTRPNRIGHSAKETLLEHRPQTATPPQPLDHL